jgi:hypothetical protein
MGSSAFIAPSHVVQLERVGTTTVHATATEQLLLCIPIRARELHDVQSVTTTTDRAPAYVAPKHSDGSGGGHTVVPEQEGTLILSSAQESLAISISPHDLYDVERDVRELLAGSDTRLQFRVVANWKVGVIVVIVVGLPGVLLLLGLLWDVVNALRASATARP